MATTTPLSPQGLSYLMLVQDDPCWIWSTQSSEGLGGFCRRCQRLCWPPGGHQPWCPSHGPLCRPQKLGQCQPGNRPAAAAPSEPLPMGRWHLPTVQSISTQSTCCTNQFQSEFRFSSNIACSKDFENYAHKNTVNGEFTGLGRGGEKNCSEILKLRLMLITFKIFHLSDSQPRMLTFSQQASFLPNV